MWFLFSVQTSIFAVFIFVCNFSVLCNCIPVNCVFTNCNYVLSVCCKRNWLPCCFGMFFCKYSWNSFQVSWKWNSAAKLFLAEGIWRTGSYWCWCCWATGSSYIGRSRLYRTNDGAGDKELLRWLANEGFISKVWMMFVANGIFRCNMYYIVTTCILTSLVKWHLAVYCVIHSFIHSNL